MADGFDGFGDDVDDDFGDDFGFDDDFAGALPVEESHVEEEKIKKAATEMKSLPRTTSFAHKTDVSNGAPASAAETDVPADEKYSRGGGVKGAEEPATGEKSGWMKMLTSGGASFKTLGRKLWKERWFTLSAGKLVIQAAPNNEKQQRTINLTHAISFEQDDPDEGDPSRFTLVTRTKELFFTARTPAEAKSWVANLKVAKEKGLGNFTSGHKQEGVQALMF